MKTSPSRVLAGLALAAIIVTLYGWHLGARSFWEPDESRYAEVGREMFVSGDWVTPRLNFLAYYEKPPLAYWSAAVGFTWFGVNETSARLGPAIFAMLYLAGAWRLARSLFGARTALAGSAILALAPLTWLTGRLLVTDMFLAAGVVWVLAGYVTALDRKRRGATTVLPMLAAGAGAAVALLAKGPIGVLLPALGIVPFRILAGRDAAIGRRGWAAAGAIAGAVGLPWFVLLSWRDPSFLKFFIWHEHVLRFFTHEAKREGPIWYYLPVLLAGLFPASLLLPWAVARHRPRLRARGWEDRGAWLLLLFGGATLALFSVSQSKLAGYILPALPVPAILVGRALVGALVARRRKAESADADAGAHVEAHADVREVAGASVLSSIGDDRVRWGLRASLGLGAAVSWMGAAYAIAVSRHPPPSLPDLGGAFGPAIALVLLGAALAAPALLGRPVVLRWGLGAAALSLFAGLLSLENVAERVDASVSVKPAALLAARSAGPTDCIASYGSVLQGLSFYTGRRTVIVGGPGELAFGAGAQDSRDWILSNDQVPDLAAGRTVYLVVPRGLESRALDRGAGRFRVLDKTPAYTVLTNVRDAERIAPR